MITICNFFIIILKNIAKKSIIIYNIKQFRKGVFFMKKTISILLCAVIIILSFAGCTGSTKMTDENISKTVDKAFSALSDFDSEELNKYVSSTTLSVIMKYAEKHPQFADLGKAIFANLSYEIIAIDTENATVTISVNNKDLFAVADKFAKDLKKNYSTMELLAKLNDSSFLDENLSSLCNDIANAPLSGEATEITLSVSQGKKNLVLVFDDDGENAVSGGALKAIKSVYSAV